MPDNKSFEQSFNDLKELAIEEAKKYAHSEIDTDHLLLALTSSDQTQAYQFLGDIVNVEKFRSVLEEITSRTSGEIQLPPTKLSKYAENAYRFAGYRYVNDKTPRLDISIHLLLGIAEVEMGIAANILRCHEITYSKLLERAEKYRPEKI